MTIVFKKQKKNIKTMIKIEEIENRSKDVDGDNDDIDGDNKDENKKKE